MSGTRQRRRQSSVGWGDAIIILAAFAIVFVSGFLSGNMAVNLFSVGQFQRETIAIDEALELYSRSQQMNEGTDRPLYPPDLRAIGIQQASYGPLARILHRRDNFNPVNPRFIYTPHADETGRFTSYTLQTRLHGGKIYTSPKSVPLNRP